MMTKSTKKYKLLHMRVDRWELHSFLDFIDEQVEKTAEASVPLSNRDKKESVFLLQDKKEEEDGE